MLRALIERGDVDALLSIRCVETVDDWSVVTSLETLFSNEVAFAREMANSIFLAEAIGNSRLLPKSGCFLRRVRIP